MSSRKVLSTLIAGLVMASLATSLVEGTAAAAVDGHRIHTVFIMSTRPMLRIGSTTTHGPRHMPIIAPVEKATVTASSRRHIL